MNCIIGIGRPGRSTYLYQVLLEIQQISAVNPAVEKTLEDLFVKFQTKNDISCGIGQVPLTLTEKMRNWVDMGVYPYRLLNGANHHLPLQEIYFILQL
jgi:hypothetical protein